MTLGPLVLLCWSCAIQYGLFVPAYPIKANELRYSKYMESVAPSLLRASADDCQYCEASSWVATITILLQEEKVKFKLMVHEKI